ncbi:MAG: motility associated factor glycosyltransferase family protein [Spirochaetales bacterium]|nr:motility associated factor glycosyltransferase family protein [Spirochaetales bacterium]
MSKIKYIQSKDNYAIPAIDNYTFHSRYSVAKEVENVIANLKPDSTVISLGLGAGHHIKQIINRFSPNRIIIITHPDIYESFIENGHVLDPSVNLIRFDSFEEIDSRLVPMLHSLYQPILHNSLSVVEIKNEVNYFSDYFKIVKANLSHFQEQLQGDIATQAELGKVWADNFFKKINFLAKGKLPPRLDKVVVVAAGPSLEEKFERIKELQITHKIISVDTAIPILEANGISADFSISIDPQFFTSMHYRMVNQTTVRVNEFLTEWSISNSNTIHFLSNHPYRLLVDKKLPAYDCSGGNASFSAVDFALKQGSQEIICVGLDFAIVNNKAYANHTAYHKTFLTNSDRFQTNETMNFRLAKPKDGKKDGNKVVTKRASIYRDLFIKKFNAIQDNDEFVIINKAETNFHQQEFSKDETKVCKEFFVMMKKNAEIHPCILPLAYAFKKRENKLSNKEAIEKSIDYHIKKASFFCN